MTTTSVRKILASMGYKNVPPMEWYSKIDVWRQWYRGKTAFHRYTIYNGQKPIRCCRKSLKMSKKMSEDRADLLLNEKVNVTVKNQNDRFQKILNDNDFWVQGNQLVEMASALGTGAFVEYQEGEDVKIDYIQDAGCIWPLSWSGRTITECAFASVMHDSKVGKIFRISLHLVRNGMYHVYNYLFDQGGRKVSLPEGVKKHWTAGSAIPTFQIYSPNIANNMFENVPMGMSIYANAIDIMKVLDTVYDSYHNEFNLGRKRIFADASVLNMDMDPTTPAEARMRPVFDPNDTVFYNYPGMESEKGKPIQESNMELRIADHRMGIQDNLDLLSEATGFGKGYYKFEVDNVQTATAVISQNSKLYRKVRKDEIVLERVLRNLAQAVLVMLGEDPEQDISVSFDDSIIEDTNTVVSRALLEYQSDVIDQVMYFMETRDLTEEAAIKLVKDIQKREQQFEPESPEDPDEIIEVVNTGEGNEGNAAGGE